MKHYSDVNLRMPGYYVVERVDSVTKKSGTTYDTAYHRMREFDFINQLGQHINRRNLDGKITVVDFFHTKGEELTPRLSAVLQKIQNTYAQSDTGLRILSFTTNPEADSVRVLKDYADQFRVNHDIWWFLRGSRQQVKDIAQRDFQVTLKSRDSGNVLYSPLLILLDRYQYVRGYFDVRDSIQVRQCVHEISLLMIEKGKPGGK